jgi:hypothetical protein
MVFKYSLDAVFFCVLGFGGIEKEGDMPSFCSVLFRIRL